jgi:hypothetical protein
MDQTIVQINFKVSVPRSDFEQAVTPNAQLIAGVDGLQWKIWSLNEADHEFCGIYLFTNEAAADAYVNGPIIAHLKEVPIFSNITIKRFSVIDSLTAITRGPTKEYMPTA